MKPLFIHYPKCTTCQKALKFLQENNMEVETRHIVEQNPTQEELVQWITRSGLEFKKFFNTSGLRYKELGLKDKVKDMTLEEAAECLASDGMLVKRPLLITEDKILVGFKQEAYSELINQHK